MSKSLKTTLTFFSFLLFVLAISAPQAEAKGHMQVRDQHLHANRFIRQRAPPASEASDDLSATLPTTSAVSSVAPASATSTSATSSSTSTAAAPTTTSTSTSTTSTSATSTTSSSSSGGGLLSDLLGGLTRTTSSSSTSTTETPTSSAPTTTPTASRSVVVVDDGDDGPRTEYVDATASAPAASSSKAPSGAATKSGTTLTVLIAVACSVGFVIVCWTIFRKWKLARSAKFDRRLNPIDWQPSNDDSGMAGAPVTHRRRGSDTSSFHSGVNHNNGSDSGHNSLQPVPDHDFTPGAASNNNLYGYNTGYADLTRGPSPAPPMPQMAQMDQLSRGPSMRSYDANVPLHHQTGYQDYGASGRA
ncbi:hypothetical protein CYLTODRAFT_409086 [Cylindrobasidium torrendii FP15055 ss-10]|uniref:Mid2 domain-containing protein n=1 Tax=Cylindrobasidium torrendii FP15055 ss-10 TaxID=1314674 RepID=A0A0D7BJ73_9AGAR|nr:hypothetical protein CYLTODRAFT_409086 [Cylindrobasidium torrendii FP15055 ss-10]